MFGAAETSEQDGMKAVRQGNNSLSGFLNLPYAIFLFSLVALWLAARAGLVFNAKRRGGIKEDRQDLDLVTGACLTLLALIIGFSFSMAISRYDQRKNYEEEEANAIGTEYVRADLLPIGDAQNVQHLLRRYLDQRVLFYTIRDPRQLQTIGGSTADLQNQMWSVVQAAGRKQPTPLVALAVSGMNDVLNRQGYTQAAWLNRIPDGAWCLMFVLAICCSAMIGYGARQRSGLLFAILPFLLSIAFFLIADIDSPRHGVIRVTPQNLISLARSLQGTN